MNIEQGQLWEVTTEEFYTTGRDNKVNRPVRLTKGEIIEIRYPYAWNFRTEDNQWFHAEPQTILDNSKLIGVIWDKVRFANKCNLKEILELELHSGFKYRDRATKEQMNNALNKG